MTLTKRGNTYHLDTTLGERRIRCSLGVRDPKAAERLANRVQFALSDGPKSPVWSELKVALPSSSFKRLTNGVLPDGPVDLTTLEQKFYEHVKRRRQLGQIGEGAKQNYDGHQTVFRPEPRSWSQDGLRSDSRDCRIALVVEKRIHPS